MLGAFGRAAERYFAKQPGNPSIRQIVGAACGSGSQQVPGVFYSLLFRHVRFISAGGRPRVHACMTRISQSDWCKGCFVSNALQISWEYRVVWTLTHANRMPFSVFGGICFGFAHCAVSKHLSISKRNHRRTRLLRVDEAMSFIMNYREMVSSRHHFPLDRRVSSALNHFSFDGTHNGKMHRLRTERIHEQIQFARLFDLSFSFSQTTYIVLHIIKFFVCIMFNCAVGTCFQQQKSVNSLAPDVRRSFSCCVLSSCCSQNGNIPIASTQRDRDIGSFRKAVVGDLYCYKTSFATIFVRLELFLIRKSIRKSQKSLVPYVLK